MKLKVPVDIRNIFKNLYNFDFRSPEGLEVRYILLLFCEWYRIQQIVEIFIGYFPYWISGLNL